MTAPDPWPEMECAKAALTEARSRLDALRRQQQTVDATITLRTNDRSALVRRVAQGDVGAHEEATAITNAIAEAETASKVLTDAMPAVEKAVTVAEDAVVSLRRGMYSMRRSEADAVLAGIEAVITAARAQHAPAWQAAEEAKRWEGLDRATMLRDALSA